MLRKVISFLFLLTPSLVMSQGDEDFAAFKRTMDSGYHYLRNFRTSESTMHFEKAIKDAGYLKSNFYYAAALFGAGQATWYAGNFRHAADTVELAIRYFPKKFKYDIIGAYRILSNIYDDLGEYEKAFRAVQSALTINENVGDTHNPGECCNTSSPVRPLAR